MVRESEQQPKFSTYTRIHVHTYTHTYIHSYMYVYQNLRMYIEIRCN